jgi:tetratricopeptide (TPR) repeat protein
MRGTEGEMGSGLVERWIAWSRELLAKDDQIPLISESLGSWNGHDLLHDAFRNGDDEFYSGFTSAVIENPTDLATRFAALNVYYRLMVHEIADWDEVGDDQWASKRESFRKKLVEFIVPWRLEATDLKTVRWEIVNSCIARDFDGALRLCEHLVPLLPAWEVAMFRGRLHFLAALTPSAAQTPYWWDLPIGPASSDGIRQLMAELMPFRLAWDCIFSPDPADGLDDCAREHLIEAIAKLTIALHGNSNAPYYCRLMLARAYSAVGQHHEAARCYEAMCAIREAFLRDCERRVGSPKFSSAYLSSGLYRRLAEAFHRAEERDKAISVAQKWTEEFPDEEFAYLLLARLHGEKEDTSSELKWYRKAADRFPRVSEDWPVSALLKLGETTSPVGAEEAVNSYIEAHPGALERIAFALGHHWEAFRCLDAESKDKWSAGVDILHAQPHGGVSAGNASHCFSWVVERALREHVFIQFKREYEGNPESFGGVSQRPERADVFCQFLNGEKGLAFGEMLKIVQMSVRSTEPPFGTFAGWLASRRPLYYQRITHLDEWMMVDLRNREDHAKSKLITPEEAGKMLDASVKLLSLLYADEGGST